MSRVQYYAAASLDGYMARPDGSIDWLQTYGAGADPAEGPISDGSYDAFYEEVGAVVMGSTTFEWIVEHASAWPYDRPGWVFTSRDLEQPAGGKVKFVRGGADKVRDEALDAADGRNAWLVGGGSLASHWADRGLIDEVIITYVPVFLGRGIPFFADAVAGELRHQSTNTHRNGMVELRFSMPQ